MAEHESSGGDAPFLSPSVVSSYESSGGDALLTDTTATQPQAAVLSPPVVSRKFVYTLIYLFFRLVNFRRKNIRVKKVVFKTTS